MSLLDPNWTYTPSVATDIRKRFEEERRRIEAEKKEKEKSNVRKLATAAGTRGKGTT